MESNREISVIIPAYNEEKRIVKCLDRTLEYFQKNNFDYELIFAEDGSTDDTVKIIQEYQKKYDNIKLFSFKEKLGKGGAIINAMPKATKKFVGFMDADLATDPSQFEKLLPEILHYDVVIGSRLLRPDLDQVKRPFHRTLFSKTYSKFFQKLFRIHISDPQCGFKLFRREIVPKLFGEVHTTQFAFDSEVIVKAYVLGLSIKEVAIAWNHDSASKVSITKQVKEMSQDLLSIWFESHMLWLQNRPTYPQKHGSRRARLLFGLLSLYKKPRGIPDKKFVSDTIKKEYRKYHLSEETQKLA